MNDDKYIEKIVCRASMDTIHYSDGTIGLRSSSIRHLMTSSQYIKALERDEKLYAKDAFWIDLKKDFCDAVKAPKRMFSCLTSKLKPH